LLPQSTALEERKTFNIRGNAFETTRIQLTLTKNLPVKHLCIIYLGVGLLMRYHLYIVGSVDLDLDLIVPCHIREVICDCLTPRLRIVDLQVVHSIIHSLTSRHLRFQFLQNDVRVWVLPAFPYSAFKKSIGSERKENVDYEEINVFATTENIQLTPC
jgi:hypothetical protein